MQPTVEAFFLVHSPQQGAAKPEKKEKEEEEQVQAVAESETSTTSMRKISKTSSEGSEQREVIIDSEKPSDSASSKSSVPPEQHFLAFAEKHRTVLNQILRQSTAHLADGPFAVLVDHTRILDFDIKRRYFRTELERMDHGVRREETAVHVRRSNIFEDSFRELFRRPPEEWKNRFYIVFEGIYIFSICSLLRSAVHLESVGPLKSTKLNVQDYYCKTVLSSNLQDM